jgi:signal transduction histidine kinase
MNPQDSVFYLLQKSSAMTDSIYRSKSSKNLAEMEVKYETLKKEQELESAKSEIKVVNLEVSKRNSQIGFLIAGLLLIVGAGSWYFYRVKQKQKLKLAEVRIAEQKKSIKAIIEAQENERQVIAKDLHDGVGQTLSALKMGLVKLSSDENTSELTQTKITQSAEIADAAYGELRTISHRMMPATLKEFGLANAIDQLLRRCFDNLDIRSNFDQTIGNKRFHKEIEIGLFRACQELVNNIIKHAHCTEVGIQLYQSKQNLILMVEDNGVGFDESESSDGIGLQNIKSRVEAIDGTITYQTSLNEGTLVIIKKSLQS